MSGTKHPWMPSSEPSGGGPPTPTTKKQPRAPKAAECPTRPAKPKTDYMLFGDYVKAANIGIGDIEGASLAGKGAPAQSKLIS
jgi:hypothetical protein